MLPIPQQYIKSKCEIKTFDDKLITTGTLSKIEENDIQILKGSEPLSILHCGINVKIQVLHKGLKTEMLIGTVYLSSPDLLQITKIQRLDDFERRNFFRLKLNIHTQAYPVKEDGTPVQPVKLFQVYILDLSLSGLFVKSRTPMQIGDCFIATLPLSGVRVSFICKVQRVQKVNSRSGGYGCSFENNTNRQYDQLCKFLFEKQREQIRNSRKDLY